MGNGGEQFDAGRRTGLDEEARAAGAREFREGEVEAPEGARSGAERRAEAGGGGMGAVDGDEEGLPAARLVDRVDERRVKEDAVQKFDSGEFAGTDAEEDLAG